MVYSRQPLIGLLAAWILVFSPFSQDLRAASTPKDLYFQADACARKLRRSTDKCKYRENWMRCIEQAQTVHRSDPDGAWAAASLFLAADLYGDLARYSGRGSDRREARDLLERIVRRFPRSAYRDRAKKILAEMDKADPKTGSGSRPASTAGTYSGRTGRQFRSAETAYKKLLARPKWQMYRDRWLAVVDKYAAVHRNDPQGPAAPAALFMTGKVYGQLYGKSYLGADKREALDLLARVVRRYPDSPFRQKAETEMRRLDPDAAIPSPPPKAAPSTAPPTEVCQDAAQAFENAESAYNRLLQRPKWQKYRDKWQQLIARFDAVYRMDPTGPKAPDALFMVGKLHQELAEHSYLASDRENGREIWKQLIREFPDSPYSGRAASAAGLAPPVATPAPATAETADDEAEQGPVDAIAETIASATEMAPEPEADAGSGPATVTGLRYWSNPRYTRVVIDADRKAGFEHRLLRHDPDLKKPQRLYVDLDQSRLSSGTDKTIPINDDLLKDVRAGQFAAETVRVVIDIKSFKTYKIFSLRNPFRIVIDVWGEEDATTAALKVDKGPEAEAPLPTVGSLAAQLSLGVSRIAVDPGHGGKDYGAPGYLKGVHEKQIVLAIGRKLVQKIRQELRCEAFLTRNDDTYLTLEERTAIANTKSADLFVSIHTNAVRDRRAYGVETYFLNLATDDDAIRVAARENATSQKNISDLQSILTDLMKNAKINESSRLAGHVQTRITGALKKKYSRIRDKGVKQAPFYVLLGAQMPAILIETSFISNPRECKRLVSDAYQERLCDGIVNGIRAYIQEIDPAAVSRLVHDDGKAG